MCTFITTFLVWFLRHGNLKGCYNSNGYVGSQPAVVQRTFLLSCIPIYVPTTAQYLSLSLLSIYVYHCSVFMCITSQYLCVSLLSIYVNHCSVFMCITAQYLSVSHAQYLCVSLLRIPFFSLLLV